MASVLITGADDPIGSETARRLVRAGHTVWLGSKDAVRGEVAGARAVQLDVTSDASVAAAAAAVGSLDVLINNVPERDTFEAGLADMVRVLEAFLPLLERSATPVVVNVSVGDPVSKAAANMVAVEYAKAHPRMRINAVEPGTETVVRLAQIEPDGPTGGYFTGQDE
jgi:NAD(P)-dependent dehydrogenase (short-subunit alcohol dehydrogenase family)